MAQAVRLRKVTDTAAIENRIYELHAKADRLDTPGPASSQKALNMMKQAVARNAKLKGPLKRPNKL